MGQLWMISGFLLAAYAIVANDALQTLGPFLSANSHRPWWILWLYACGILAAVLLYGWWTNHGDIAYGRLAHFPLPDSFNWFYLIPPLSLLVLTQWGIPVSTTFLILTAFESSNLSQMLLKSLFGYLLAFGLTALLYPLITWGFEKAIFEGKDEAIAPYWFVLQWTATGFLWSQWLIQDLANIFVYLPRQLSLPWLSFALSIMFLLHAWIFYQKGGAIEHIITTKTNVGDIRSATLINFIYGVILLFFVEYSQMPMSTTWVFVGLLAGRELAIAQTLALRPLATTCQLILVDLGKAGIGLGVSAALALAWPRIIGQMG